MAFDDCSGEDQPGPERMQYAAIDPAFAAAQSRVAAHLKTFGDDADHVRRLAQALTLRAVQRSRRRPERDLGEFALEEAEADVSAWSYFVLGRERVGDHPAALVARAAYRACGGATRWPSVLLRYDLPGGFVDEMRAAAPPVTPPEAPGRMVLQPLETWSPTDVTSPRLWSRLVSVLVGTSRV